MRLFGTTVLSFQQAPLRWAAALWIVAMGAVLLRAYWQGHGPARQTVYPAYADAGRHWLAGTDAYEMERDAAGQRVARMADYRYAPTVSVFFVPFSLLPDALGGVAWRALSYLVYMGAILGFLRAVVPGIEAYRPIHMAAFALLVLPLSLPSMNNGQANVLVIALLMAAVAACARDRWNVAALCLAGAFFLKLYPLAVALLLVVVYPRQLGWRLPAALAAGFLVPFAFQRTDYVLEQYETWLFLLGTDDRTAFAMTHGYRDFWLLTRFVGMPLPHRAYVAVQLGAAAAVAGICLLARIRAYPKREMLLAPFVLGCCWMIVFGPATESCTFILLAPALAWAVVDAFRFGRPRWVRTVVAAAFGMLLLSFIACWFRETRNMFYLLQPVAALLFMVERFVFFTRVRDHTSAVESKRQGPHYTRMRVETCELQEA